MLYLTCTALRLFMFSNITCRAWGLVLQWVYRVLYTARRGLPWQQHEVSQYSMWWRPNNMRPSISQISEGSSPGQKVAHTAHPGLISVFSYPYGPIPVLWLAGVSNELKSSLALEKERDFALGFGWYFVIDQALKWSALFLLLTCQAISNIVRSGIWSANIENN